MKTEISLSNKKYFELFIGKRILKKEIFQSKGEIPIYSANVFEPFGYSDKTNIKDFEHDYLLWGIDGNFEFNIIPKGTKFSTTDHCGCIKILDTKINTYYMLYQLNLKTSVWGYDRTLRPSLKIMNKLSVEFPVLSNGKLNTNEQERIATKQEKINSIKQKVFQRAEQIVNAGILIDPPKLHKRIALKDLFDFPETNSGMTQSFCNENFGSVPVYGCSESEESVLGHIKENIVGIKYYRDCLGWNRNGSVGKVFFRKGLFSTNEDHRVMKLKEEFKGKIDLFYIKYALENEIKEKGFSFTNKLGKSKIQDIGILIPLDKKEKINLDEQIGMREKYTKLNSLKDKLTQEVYSVKDTIVET